MTKILKQAPSLIELNSESSASGIGVQILDNSGKPLPLGIDIPLSGNTAAASGNFSIPLRAAYYKIASTVKGGTANVSLTYTMNYQQREFFLMPHKFVRIVIADRHHGHRLSIEKSLNALGYFRIVLTSSFEEACLLSKVNACAVDLLIGLPIHRNTSGLLQWDLPFWSSHWQPSRWAAAPGGPAFFAYSTNYLFDTEHGVIMDVGPTPAHRTAEV